MPEGFGRRFSIFVDTEEEFDWAKPHSRDKIDQGAGRDADHPGALPRG